MFSLQPLHDMSLSSNYTSSHVACEENLVGVWEGGRYKSQPGYVLGKLIRKSVKSLAHLAKRSFHFISRIYRGEDFFESSPVVEKKRDGDIRFKKEITSIYHDLQLKLKRAADQAKKTNKPLLVIVGEDHYSFSSTINEFIILKILSSQFSVDTIYSECFSFVSYSHDYGNYMVGTPNDLLEDEINKMGLNKVPIDLANCDLHLSGFGRQDLSCAEKHKYPQVDEPESVHSLKVRNTVMSQVIDKKSKANVMAIVGGLHLYGLAEETDLKDHFHLFLIDTADLRKYFDKTEDSYEMQCVEYVLKNNIYSVVIQSLKSQHLYSLSKKLDLLDKVDEILEDEECKMPSIDDNLAIEFQVFTPSFGKKTSLDDAPLSKGEFLGRRLA